MFLSHRKTWLQLGVEACGSRHHFRILMVAFLKARNASEVVEWEKSSRKCRKNARRIFLRPEKTAILRDKTVWTTMGSRWITVCVEEQHLLILQLLLPTLSLLKNRWNKSTSWRCGIFAPMLWGSSGRAKPKNKICFIRRTREGREEWLWLQVSYRMFWKNTWCRFHVVL